MPGRPPDARTLRRLHDLLAAARAGEEAQVARIAAEIAACRARAAQLRQEVAQTAMPRDSGAADLAAAMRWQLALGRRAGAEEAHIRDLEAAAQSAREGLARAFRRERAMAVLLARAERAARREAERRAEATAAPRRGGSQPSSPESERGGASDGSPGMA